MKQKLLTTMLAVACLTSVSYAQTRQVSGKVTSSEGLPIAGASVSVIGGSVATQTDAAGNFTLNVPQGARLSVSYVGYNAQTVIVGNSSTLSIVLDADDLALEEVVVTALGITRDKKSLGYAAQEVKGDVLTAARGGNALQSLSGNVAGAVISAPSSSLGGSTRIVLRGI